jgi:beta-lactamase class A
MRAVGLFFLATPLLFAAPDPSMARLEQQIRFVSQISDGVVGVSAVHIESGRAVGVRGAEGFPMASAFKVPVAVAILTLVDEGKLSLGQMIALGPADIHPGSGDISDLMFHPGVSLSIENLMELMLVVSDNSAADVMLRVAGGPEAVTARMRAIGLPGIRVDRSTALLISDWVGVKNVPPESQWTLDSLKHLQDSVPNNEHMQARRAEMKDPKDTATPDDMTRLLVRIWKKDLLTPSSSGVLIGVMERCETGKARIKGMLPQGADVAHKTGTLGGVVNDVGVITLPNDLGHVALSVFTKASNKPADVSEKAVAEVARTIYDYFVLVPAAVPGQARN